LKRHEDKDLVWMGDKVGADTGLANVVVFLRAPAGKHFKIEGTKYEKIGQDKELGTKVMDQPFCAYEPRVVVLYPAYSTGDDTRESGQRFIVKNSATILHNTKIIGNPEFNSIKSPTIPPKSEEIIKKLVPQPEPFKVTCDVHPWMNGVIWAFNHPFAGRTEKDGKFRIEVPAGVEVDVVIWHEGLGFYKGDGFDGDKGKKMNFSKDQKTELNLKVTK
jgi:hypothetical protein